MADLDALDVLVGEWSMIASFEPDPAKAPRARTTFEADGARIDGAWDFSADGVDWQHDFELSYRKVGP